jgi:probable rRNA maturation factor
VTDDGGHPAVLISNRQAAPIDEDGLISLARDTLLGEGVQAAELSVSFVEEAEMADLHVRFMGEEGPTDVLSFPQDEVDGESVRRITNDDAGIRLLGDVVIAPAVAARNHPDDPEAELRLLLVHGILHVLGYDHEEEAERAEMWARQERYSGVRVP